MKALSEIVGQRAKIAINRIIIICVAVFVVIAIGLMISKANGDSKNKAELYLSRVETNIQEKISFIDTIASGVASGAVSSDKYYDYVNEMVGKYEDVSAVYVCIPEDKVKYKDGIMTYMSGGWLPPDDFIVSEREWFSGAVASDSVYISEPYIDEQSGGICITISKKVNTSKGVGTVGMDLYLDGIMSLAESSYVDGNYISIITAAGTVLTSPDERYALKSDASVNVEETPYKNAYDKNGKVVTSFIGGLKNVVAIKSELTGWTVIYVNSLTPVLLTLVLIIAGFAVASFIGIKFAENSFVTSIKPNFAPLEYVAQNVNNISEGNLSYTFEVDENSEEVYAVTKNLNDTIISLDEYIKEINSVVENIALKNLDVSVSDNFEGDFVKIKQSLENIIDMLNSCFTEIKEQAFTVKEYSDNLAQTSESVANSATKQSQSIITANKEVDSLVDRISEIANLAMEVDENAKETNAQLTNGGHEMTELVKAMDEIVACFDGISNFVSEITVIATQTNLLSLNASIEAARAGEAGRGFSVVAGEIQQLSDSSAKASENIERIVEQSKKAVDIGKELVEKTRNTIESGISYSVENAKNVSKIVSAVENQKASVAEISESFKEISFMVESNAASAEENSAIAIQLGDCAKTLSDNAQEFKLK